jgi:hypothetical protein
VPADCQNDRKGEGCTACINEHAQLCYGASGACTSTLNELSACLAASFGDAAAGACPIDRIPASRGCVPSSCQDRAQALDACLYDCQAALSACTGM